MALNECARDLCALIQNDPRRDELKKCITRSLHSLEKPFDTEDREYVLYYYNQLAQIVGINVSLLLNSWLYGFPLAVLLQPFSRR